MPAPSTTNKTSTTIATSAPVDIQLSPLDEARFGIVTARASNLTNANIDMALEFCRSHNVKLFIVRIDANDLSTTHAIENAGGRLMDVLVYYGRDLDENLPVFEDRCNVRIASADDADALERIADAAFTGYVGHYHADPRLDSASATAAYASWARRSCSVDGVADCVLVAELDGEVVGFSTIRLNSETEGEVVLNGVAPNVQRRGIYRSLIVHSIKWIRSQGRRRFVISTHLTNLVVRRVWAQYGLEPYASYFTFHLWFD